ncbi:DUF3040 domain-containing protein [Zhihengliuella salsuginis]|uniref:DUF3040 domain-containing protein n=1 Tax=Zhihengliuella salsuginis TaxID=578222 RepID=A0ABQ3GBP6_9MICC|nr:DUF3040 domain-containing protein [Zhihengliuella salsuginis]GHD00922.1 hypothetical protein GCM10008096_04430 [Zhihengliuella salsuginis]
MPLSDHEQRLLEQLEKQLHQDQRFASTMKSGGGYSTRNIVIGALIGVVGVIALLVGISSQLIIIGVIGFALMCIGVYFALSKRGSARSQGPSKKSPGKGGSSFMADLEAKWDERRRDQEF